MGMIKDEAVFLRLQAGKEAREKEILTLPNVVGVGLGYKEVKGKETKEVCVSVYVEKKVPRDQLSKNQLVPSTLVVPETTEEVKVDVREVGRVVALAFNSRVRPAKPGHSIGHYRITAGTFGCLARDACYPGHIYILSNNHVLANSNAAAIGDSIIQPGRVDGGSSPGDKVATLSRFVPIHFGGVDDYNLVDAALARPVDMRMIMASINALGIPRGIAEATLGMEVTKSGRTTQVTTGKVIGVDATIRVGYHTAGTAYFRNQIITSNMSRGGDSGSLLMSREGHMATGLLFAGSNKVTVHNNILNVMMALRVDIITA